MVEVILESTVRLEKIKQEHWRPLYEIVLRAESFNRHMVFEQFATMMQKREGFTIIVDSDIAGCISFSDFTPETNIIIHCSVDEKFRRRWCTREILHEIAVYVYETLGLHRMSGFSICGVTDEAGEFLLKLGFKVEGIIRKGVKLPAGYYDVKIFGLLKEECKWL